MSAYSYTNSKGNTYILHSRVTTLKNGQSNNTGSIFLTLSGDI